MKSHSSTAVDRLSKLSLLGTTALIASFGFAPMAFAQDNTTSVDDEDVVVSTGIRQSLKEARDLKRDADTAVDSITASDVGALPDLSVAEALSRIPGVVAQRFDINNDNGGDFPSPEGGGNLIRGLTLVRTEFNGRDAFSANGGRALDFGTIPPELIGAVDVFKNTTADMIEGGIGGTINLRTLEPFDRQGLVAVASIDGTYTDLRKEWSPDFSAVLGNRWDTSAGEFGLLGSFSSSELQSELHGFQIGQVIPFNTGDQIIALPNGFQLRTNEVDRERESYYIAGQWQDPSGDLRLTAKYSRIDNETEGNERTLEFFGDGESFGAYSVDGLTTTPFSSSGIAQCNGSNDPSPTNPTCEITVPVTGLYETGVINNSLRDWTGARGANFTNLGINQVDKSTTDDISLNLKWRPSDQWYVQLDGHRTTAESTRERLWAGSRFFSDFTINADLDNPSVGLLPRTDSNPIRRAGGGAPTSGILSDPSNSFLLFAADEFRDNEGDMYALRGDIEYEFDNDGWFDSVKFGARYAERDQVNRQAGLNWAGVAPPWTGAVESNGFQGGYLPYTELNTPGFEVVDFAGFFRGGVVQGANSSVVFADRELIQDYDAFVAAIFSDINISNPDEGLNPDWNPLRDTNGVVAANTAFGGDGVTPYSSDRGSIGDVTEKTQNYYARLDFGNEFNNGMSIEGNVGVRYTKSDVSGVGGLNFGNLLSAEGQAGNLTANDLRLLNFIPDAVAFSQQESTVREGTFSSTDFWLPSLNVKWNLNDSSLIRFAASETITRPRIDQLNGAQFANVQNLFISTDDLDVPEDERIIDITTQQIVISGGNPDLQPIESTNLDLSFEHYFGDNNSLTLSLFNKDIRNNIVNGAITLDTVSLDGDDISIRFAGDLNQDEATIRGLELAYQQFYDGLPGFLGNLGVQANYTYIDADTNAPIPFLDSDQDGNPDGPQDVLRFGVTDFLGLSEHAANLIGIYQDDRLEMRLAYNWRSEYLGSYRDFVSGNPIFQQPTGYLDGSIKYDLTENFQIRAQIANITDEKANSEQQIDADGTRFGRTSFVGDRRIRIGARYAF
ncbi:TonB-dependent receptor [Litorimonas sp. WD9-15]|uniref:TonB-dependent receptor n=1 Tax=Litorimonas sp. WD9-15 TaxID=3418716 RepID=UPI003D076C35